jgi:hypothetical protein
VEGASEGAPSLGTLEDILIKSLDEGISLHGGPFPPKGNLVCGGGGGGSYTGVLGTFQYFIRKFGILKYIII